MNRRSFLTRIGVAVVGLTLARHLPGIAPPVPPVLTPPAGIYASDSLQCGDMFTIEGRYAVNPLTRQPTAMLQRFVVTEDVSAGLVQEETIYPSMLTSGPYANVHIASGTPQAVTIDPVLWSGPYTGRAGPDGCEVRG